MADKTKSSSEQQPKTGSLVQNLQSTAEKEAKQGFRGIEVDPTPNENYTVQGVTSGAPTPETDAGLAKDVRQQTGVGLSALEAADREKTQRGEK